MSVINNNELLSFEQLKLFCLSQFPGEKAVALCTHLKKYMIIKSDRLYIVQPNITYQYFKDDKSKIVQYCSLYVENSFKFVRRSMLSSDNDDTIELFNKFQKQIDGSKTANPFSNAFYEKILPQIKNELINEKQVFDINLDEMHFENGYMDFNTLEFKPRDRAVHYITNCIKRNYEASSLADQNKVQGIFKQIYPNNDDFECVKMIIGSGLSGRSIKDTDMLFLLGQGSAGKSTALLLTQLAIDCYLEELNSDTFSFEASSSNKADKIINTFSNKPYVRIAWINELKDVRLNESLFKTFCEGVIQTCKLYQEGSHSITHMAKPIITANIMPIFKTDSGMTRRITAFTHTSTFVDDVKKVNPDKDIYLKDSSLLESIQNNDGLKNAWFDILAQSCSRWLGGTKIIKTTNFINTKEEVCTVNDDIQDLIDSQLIITNNVEDRIGKLTMAEIYKTVYPHKMKTSQTLIANFKEKNIKYDGQIRSKMDNIRGCYIGVKVKSLFDNQEPFISDDEDETHDYQKLYFDAIEQIKVLKKKLNSKNLDNTI